MSSLGLVLAAALILLPQASGILEGDSVDWNRHASVVKVLSLMENGEIAGCTGSLISTRLVLTAVSCVKDARTMQHHRDFTVILPDLKQGKRRVRALFMESKKNWAVLGIPEQNVNELCPEDPVPKRIARLNLRPSLKEAALTRIEDDTLKNSRCYLVGFETTSKASDFMYQKKMFRIELEPLVAPFAEDSFYRSRIVQNQTACYDDMGAAVVCHIPYQREIQVGMFQSLATTSKRKVHLNSLEACSLAAEMRFSLVTDDPDLIDVIETHDLTGFVAAYKKCQFI